MGPAHLVTPSGSLPVRLTVVDEELLDDEVELDVDVEVVGCELEVDVTVVDVATGSSSPLLSAMTAPPTHRPPTSTPPTSMPTMPAGDTPRPGSRRGG